MKPGRFLAYAAGGFLAGLALPLLVFLLENYAHVSPAINGKKNIAYVIAIGLNLIIMRFLLRAGRTAVFKGMLSATFLFSLLIFLYRSPA